MSASEKIVDFNLHDLVGIRLINPATRDVQLVERHLGLAPAGFPGEIALTIRFVDRLSPDPSGCFLGRDDVAFTDEDFILLRSRNLARARAKLQLEKVGESCELTCESGLPAIPLLRPLLNLVLLARGIVPVHAAAFRHEGRGVMITGWSHGSKTGTLLAFMAKGAEFVGDEWIYLDAARNQMHGLPDELEARPWYLRELPQYRRHVGTSGRVRTAVAATLAQIVAPLVPRSERRNSLGSKLVRYFHQALLDQQSIHLKPLELFGADVCILSSTLDLVIVAVSSGERAIEVAPASISEVAARMAASFVHEHAGLLSTYHKHLFAFPGSRNALLDRIEELYRQRAEEALRGRQCFTMRHPYPVSIEALRNGVEPMLRQARASTP